MLYVVQHKYKQFKNSTVGCKKLLGSTRSTLPGDLASAEYITILD